MKLSAQVNSAITKRFKECKPRSFNAKVNLIISCPAISPRPTYRQARSLLSQRNSLARKARKQREEAALIRQEERALQVRKQHSYLYD